MNNSPGGNLRERLNRSLRELLGCGSFESATGNKFIRSSGQPAFRNR
jgi:hypothetical protein